MGGKPSKEADDEAAEVKPWQGRGGVGLLSSGKARGEGKHQRFTAISKGGIVLLRRQGEG
jgi:hypothetical protein